jgi:uncharacterized protein (DUF1499 family)
LPLAKMPFAAVGATAALVELLAAGAAAPGSRPDPVRHGELVPAVADDVALAVTATMTFSGQWNVRPPVIAISLSPYSTRGAVTQGGVEMQIVKWIAMTFAALAMLALLAGQFGLFAGSPPGDLGVREGKLKRPSDTANSVSSQALLWPGHHQREEAQIAPLALRGDGPTTLATLSALLQADPGATLVDSRVDYLRVQYTTRLMKFVDDVEFWFDPVQGVLQVRSASRVGHNDFGVNRRRIERLREKLAAS